MVSEAFMGTLKHIMKSANWKKLTGAIKCFAYCPWHQSFSTRWTPSCCLLMISLMLFIWRLGKAHLSGHQRAHGEHRMTRVCFPPPFRAMPDPQRQSYVTGTSALIKHLWESGGVTLRLLLCDCLHKADSFGDCINITFFITRVPERL